MAENKIKASTAATGLNLDADPISLEEGEYTFALNATISNKTGGEPFIGNDEGNILKDAIPEGYIIMGNKNLDKNDTVLLIANSAGDSEIGIFEKGKYRKIANDRNLGFSIHEPIQVKYKKNSKGQRIIYYTRENRPPYWFNLEKPNYIKILDPTGCMLIDGPDLDMDYMKIFKDYVRPCVTVADVTENGRILSGSYFITSQYADANSNGLTAWFPLVGPIPIFKDSLGQANESIAGMDSEELTTKSILLRISGSDTSFTHINIGIVRITNGVKRPFLVSTIPVSTTEYLYTGAGNTEIHILLSDVVQPPVAYSSARTVESTNKELLLGNLKSEKLFNFQPYVSKVQVQWQMFKSWSDNTLSSFKNPLFSAYMRTFREDEVYALGLTIEMIDGTESTWHIPGRRKNLKADGEKFPDGIDQFGDAVPGAEWDTHALLINDDIIDPTKTQRYQNYNTALITGSLSSGTPEGLAEYGEMAYWESTETYPCDKNVYGEDAGLPIRHHKFLDSTIMHIHDGQNNNRLYNEKVKLNYLGVYLPNIELIMASLPATIKSRVKGWRLAVGDRTYNKSVIASGIMLNARKQNWRYPSDSKDDFRLFPNYPLNDLRPDPYIKKDESPLNDLLGQSTAYIDYRKDVFFFHSPDTHFKKSFLATGELKITAELYGKTDSFYEFMDPYPEFKEKGGDNDRAALQGVSIATYNNYKLNPRGNTRRKLSDAFYVPFNSKVSGGSTSLPIWNILRESSTLLATTKEIIDPSVKDNSRFILNDTDANIRPEEMFGCTVRNRERTASIYYATIKNNLPNQYGQLSDIRYNDSYKCTGIPGIPSEVIFTGDTFIGPFSLKLQHSFYQNVQKYMNSPVGMEGADFLPAETIAHTKYFYRNRGGNARKTSYMMCEDNTGHGILGMGDGNPTALGFLAMVMYGVPNFWAESDVNLQLRHAGELPEDTFYKNLNQGVYKLNDWLNIKNVNKDNSYKVNEDYSAKNDIKLLRTISPLYDPLNDEDNHYSTRVIGSLSSQPEDILDNWIRFRPLDYKDLSKTRGELVDIRYLGNYKTIFRMEQGVFVDSVYSKLGTSDGELSLGSGKMFEKEPTEMLTTDNGYGGTSSQLAFNLTPAGAFFPSANQGKVFVITDTLKEITDGVSNWFGENLPFILAEQIPGISKDNASNPEGTGLLCEWDEENKRWFLTKKDYSVLDPANIPMMHYKNGQIRLNNRAVSVNDKSLFENKSWTLSYSPKTQRWVSWHSFLPGFYISQDLSFYTGETHSIWQHNQPGIYHTYYGRKYPFIVENADKLDGMAAYVNPNLSFITRVMGKHDASKMITFNKAQVYNLYEHSGLLNLIIQDELKLSSLFSQLQNNDVSRDVALRIREGHFNFSDFYNIVRNNEEEFFTSDWNNSSYQNQYPIDKVVNNLAVDYKKRNGDYGLLRERWLKYRLILDNRHDLKLLLQFVLISNRETAS